MTDSEIIKALEYCGTKGAKCTECPAFERIDDSKCKDVLLGARDLINRQKVEIERYKRYYFNHEYDKWEKEIKAEAVKEFAGRLMLCYEAFDEENEIITPANIEKAIQDCLVDMGG